MHLNLHTKAHVQRCVGAVWTSFPVAQLANVECKSLSFGLSFYFDLYYSNKHNYLKKIKVSLQAGNQFNVFLDWLDFFTSSRFSHIQPMVHSKPQFVFSNNNGEVSLRNKTVVCLRDIKKNWKFSTKIQEWAIEKEFAELTGLVCLHSHAVFISRVCVSAWLFRTLCTSIRSWYAENVNDISICK